MADSSPIEDALAALRAGLVVGVPTDTVYGIAADPWRRSAVERLFTAKGRPESKPIPVLGAHTEQVKTIAVLDEAAQRLATGHWPGALTLVLPRAPGLPEWIGDAASNSVGVRIPDHPLTLELLAMAGPLAVTSANVSGGEAAVSAVSAHNTLGDAVSVYLPGRGAGGPASTVVDLTGPAPRVLRTGPVAVEAR